LKKKKKDLIAQKEEFRQYIKACIEQYTEPRKLKKKFTNQQIKYTCQQLIKKKVITSINMDVPENSIILKLSKLDVPGHFRVRIFVDSYEYDKIKLEMEELLEKQANNQYDMEILNGKVTLNVNRMIHTLNKMIK